MQVNGLDPLQQELANHLQKPSHKAKFMLKQKALKYVMIREDLYRRSFNGTLLKYVNQVESVRLMREVHEGLCSSHRSSPMMKWLFIQHRYYWTRITIDCHQYAKGCIECQNLDLCKDFQSRKFMLWLNPGHQRMGYECHWKNTFNILQETRSHLGGHWLFTKWVEVEPLVNVTQEAMI